jgi:hypothetical protein
MKNKRDLRASIKIEIEYHQGKNVLTKRFPSSIEIEDFHFSPYKLLDKEERIITNEILMYHRIGSSSFEKAYGGEIMISQLKTPLELTSKFI